VQAPSIGGEKLVTFLSLRERLQGQTPSKGYPFQSGVEEMAALMPEMQMEPASSLWPRMIGSL
jgi:hypothetical protein